MRVFTVRHKKVSKNVACLLPLKMARGRNIGVSRHRNIGSKYRGLVTSNQAPIFRPRAIFNGRACLKGGKNAMKKSYRIKWQGSLHNYSPHRHGSR